MFLNLNGFGSTAMALIRRGGLFLKHISPELLTGVGVVGVVVGTVLACKETLKVEEILDKTKETVDEIKETQEIHPEYSDEDVRKDLAVTYTRTGMDLVKLYAPSVLVGALSIACIVGGNRILRKRNAALTAAYMGLSEAFKQYRKRVVEEQGKDADMRYRFGIKKEDVVVEDENGNQEVKTVNVADPLSPSQYARYFNHTNPNWDRNPEQSLLFLRMRQKECTDFLQANGHIFLNEVYDRLGLPRSLQGQEVGWVIGMGDDFVDFGVYSNTKEHSQDFVNGYTDSILLDFNVDGPILHIFDKVWGEDFSNKVLRDDVQFLKKGRNEGPDLRRSQNRRKMKTTPSIEPRRT